MNRKLAKAVAAHVLTSYRWDRIPSNAIRVANNRIQAQIEICNGTQIISFPGSVELSDWWLNVQFCKEYGIHKGFLKAHRAIWPWVLRHLDPNIPVVIGGHSHGGPLAGLTAEQIPDQTESVLLFNSPRWLSHDDAKAYNSLLGHKTWNIWYKSDFVSHLPPFFFDYGTVGQIVNLESGGWWTSMLRSLRRPGIQSHKHHSLEVVHAALSS